MDTELFQGLGHGLLGLLGLGEVYDPLGKLKGELSSAKDGITDIINAGTLSTLNAQVKYNETLVDYINEKDVVIQETMQYYNTLASNTTQEQNYFIAFSIILIFILTFFMIIKKN
jgi:hypothetical protein